MPEVLSVPLIIGPSVAGVRPGIHDRVTRSIDLLPTLLGLSGISDPRAETVQWWTSRPR